MKKWMKQLFTLALVCALAFSSTFTTVANASSYTETPYVGEYYGRVTAVDGLYVYTKPDTTSERKDGGVSYNWIVQCLTYTSNGFTKIRYYYGSKDNVFTGYVRSRYLEVRPGRIPEKKEVFENIYGYIGTVTADNLNAHSSLDFVGNDKKIFTTIKKNTKVTIIAKSANWYKVYMNYRGIKKVAYLSRKYVKVSDAMNNLSIWVPSYTYNSNYKYQLKVLDPTKPYALSKKIKWSSSKSSVAAVSGSGYITAKNPGVATITAAVKCGDRTKKVKVKITVKEFFTLQ